MKVYQVGPDIPDGFNYDEIDDKRYEWVIHNYVDYDLPYSAGGKYAALGKDGFIYTGSLDHCSCYGPLDDFYCGSIPCKYTVEEFLKDPDNIFDDKFSDELKKKVKELCGR